MCVASNVAHIVCRLSELFPGWIFKQTSNTIKYALHQPDIDRLDYMIQHDSVHPDVKVSAISKTTYKTHGTHHIQEVVQSVQNKVDATFRSAIMRQSYVFG